MEPISTTHMNSIYLRFMLFASAPEASASGAGCTSRPHAHASVGRQMSPDVTRSS